MNRIKNAFLNLKAMPKLRSSKWFNETYYTEKNPDAVIKGDPLRHYLRHGAKEGLRPSARFDGAYYLKTNPDVAASGMNPLVHFILYGQKEGRQPKKPLPKLSDAAKQAKTDNYLLIDFVLGGGTPLYVKNEILPSVPQDVTLFHVKYHFTQKISNVHTARDGKTLENAYYRQMDEMFDDLLQITFAKIVIINLVTWKSLPDVLDFIAKLKKKTPETVVEYKVLDYYCVCPSFTLIDADGKYCGIRNDEDVCRRCLENNPNGIPSDDTDFPNGSVTAWRTMWRSFLMNTADHVDIISEASGELLRSVYPELGDRIRLTPIKVPSLRCLRVAVIGYLSVAKGAEVIEKLAAYLDENDLDDMLLYHFGGGLSDRSFRHLIKMGAYNRMDLPNLLKEKQIDVVFIPSVCPETFCYAMGESLMLGYPTACFDLGGQAEQAKKSGKGIILREDDPAYMYRTLMDEAGREIRGSDT